MNGRLKTPDLEKWIKAGQPIAGKSDGGGLTFTLSRAGTASWVFRYRYGPRQREVTLGNYPDVSLADARKKATAQRVLVDEGRDVASEKRKERSAALGAMLFCELGEDYLKRTAKALVQRSQHEVRRFLKKDINPRIGNIPARDLASAEIVALVEEVAKRSDPVARRCFGLVSLILAHGVAKGVIDSNPCAGLSLMAILGPEPAPRPRIKLTREELGLAFGSFARLGRVLELACKILLATCVRKSELLHAKKVDVDLERGLWQVYAKGGTAYVVPLAPTVVEWFRELIALAGDSRWVLPSQHRRGRVEDRHMGVSTLNFALKRLNCGTRAFTPHDLRSTARSYLTAQPPHGCGVNIIVAERCLNHTLGGLVATYDVHDYIDERRDALEKWAKLLVELEGGPQKVVPLRRVA